MNATLRLLIVGESKGLEWAIRMFTAYPQPHTSRFLGCGIFMRKAWLSKSSRSTILFSPVMIYVENFFVLKFVFLGVFEHLDIVISSRL